MKLLAVMAIFSSVLCLPAVATEVQHQNEEISNSLSKPTSVEGEEQNVKEDEATGLRKLKNCSREYSQGKYYKICRSGTNNSCLKMKSENNVGEATYDGSDDFLWLLTYTELVRYPDKERISLKNKGHDHLMIAKDISSNDGTSNFKLWSGSSCDNNVKIGYYEPTGGDNQWLWKGRKWRCCKGLGSRYSFKVVST